MDIRKIEHIEINKDNDKMILIAINNKIYKLEHSNKDYIQEWYKSLCLVRSKSEEYLDLNRYVDTQVFEKVTGKNIFTDYEDILGKHFDEIEKEERKKEEEEKKIREEQLQKELEAQRRIKQNDTKKKKKAKKGEKEDQKQNIPIFNKEDMVENPYVRGDSLSD